MAFAVEGGDPLPTRTWASGTLGPENHSCLGFWFTPCHAMPCFPRPLTERRPTKSATPCKGSEGVPDVKASFHVRVVSNKNVKAKWQVPKSSHVDRCTAYLGSLNHHNFN